MTLTLVGIGTAFIILLVLGALMALVGWLARRQEGRVEAEGESGPAADVDLARDRALAAVVAVGLLMARREAGEDGGPRD